MNTITTIYHSNCSDGTAAVAVMELYARLNNLKHITHSAQYGDPVPLVTGDVYIVDFSYDRDTIIELAALDDVNLTVIDHHATAQEALVGLDYCIFDMDHSGAVLTWIHMFPDLDIPQFLLLIEDRDLWKWLLSMSHEFHAGLQIEPLNYKLWATWLDDIKMWKNVFNEFVTAGRYIRKYQQQCVAKTIRKDLKIVDIGGYRVPYINCTHLISEVGNELVDKYPFVAMWFETNASRIVSLRSNGDINVGSIARQHNGGGHRPAASFSMKLSEVDQHLKLIHTTSPSTNIKP